ncbi:hypothetical protein FYK55_27560 [Roseiconus nitratireducens]|uniref:Uncharacterized protein n=1 Tax=Roseiconus nitratireducens TaxID=2605748 RepID=A0A5M6CVU7_9BACT|nr:hypothetical protein [Roseiconus nitratireducens]KAA5538500.1 hypothetical protein FYK55_27560 [Roseiconus nitratireducens]
MIRIITFGLLASIAVATRANETAPANSTGRDVLSLAVGTWDVQFDRDDPISRGTRTGEWVLGGAFFEETGAFNARFVPNDVTFKTLTKYDEKAKQYKRWSFLSNGRELVSIGTWDAKTSTMTWVSEHSESLSRRTIRTKSTEEYHADGTVMVSKVSKDADREVGRSSELRTRQN